MKCTNYMKLNIGNISSQFSVLTGNSSDTTMDKALLALQISKTDTIKLSNNDTSGSDLILSYSSPINESLTDSAIFSIIPSILGSYSSRSGLVWIIY